MVMLDPLALLVHAHARTHTWGDCTEPAVRKSRGSRVMAPATHSPPLRRTSPCSQTPLTTVGPLCRVEELASSHASVPAFDKELST